MNTKYIAAQIVGKNIMLIDKNGYRGSGASSPGLAWDETYTSAYINGNFLIATTSRNTVITWDISGTPTIVSRR